MEIKKKHPKKTTEEAKADFRNACEDLKKVTMKSLGIERVFKFLFKGFERG